MNEDAFLDSYWEDRISGQDHGDWLDHGGGGGDPDFDDWNGDYCDKEDDE